MPSFFQVPGPASRARGSDARSRTRARRWRARGRRAQVAPVATVLGLLLVVTYIATYLSTTLPNQMSVNDLNHDLLVQNQVGQVSVVTDQIALAGAVGGQQVFPISLGSAGTPPFAGPDGAEILPLINYTGGSYGVYVNYSITSAHGTVALSATSVPGAGFVVGLRNTYASASEVAYDDGAVVFAQPGGVPTMADPPAITLSTAGTLSIVLPTFTNPIGVESGTSLATIGLRLTSFQSVALPISGYALASVPVTITVFTPYAAAWLNYFAAQPSFASATITCTPTAVGPQSVCSTSNLYEPGQAIGKVTISVSPSALALTQGYFAVTLG